MPPSSGVTPVSGRMLAPCVTTTSVPGSVHAAILARAPAVNSPTRPRNVKALLKVGESSTDRASMCPWSCSSTRPVRAAGRRHAPRPTPRSEWRFRDLRTRSPRRQFGKRRHRNHALLITNPLKKLRCGLFSRGLRHGASGRSVPDQDCTRPKTVDVGRTYIAEAEARIGRGTSSSRGSCGREGDRQMVVSTAQP